MRSLDSAGGSVAQTDVRNSRMLDIIKPNVRWEAESHPAATKSKNTVILSSDQLNKHKHKDHHPVYVTAPPTCLISLFSLCIPVRSVLVAPVWPISWMEMAGLVAVDWIGRTEKQRNHNLDVIDEAEQVVVN